MTSKSSAFALSRPITRLQRATQRKTVSQRPTSKPPRTSRRTKSSMTTTTSSSSITPNALVTDLQLRLDATSDHKYKKWMEAYMRGVIPCRGVRMPQLRKTVKEWTNDNSLIDIEKKQLHKQIAEELFISDLSEDKISAAVFLGEVLLPKKLVSFEYFEMFENLFDEGYIHSWNVTDLFCLSLMYGMIKEFGEKAIDRIAAWSRSENVWRARSSVVSFICLKKQSEYYELIRENCEILIRRDERFAKTSVGWILREISRQDEAYVLNFVKENAEHFSLEAVKNATKWCGLVDKKEYCDIVKAANKNRTKK